MRVKYETSGPTVRINRYNALKGMALLMILFTLRVTTGIDHSCMKTVENRMLLWCWLLIVSVFCVKCSEVPDEPPNLKYPEDYCASSKINSTWDFIVVGAGSAGAVVARRLAENPKWKVLLIEAGGDPPPEWLPISGTATPNPATAQNQWPYYTNDSDLCLGFDHGGCDFRRAKVLGGCSSNNFMMYVRGSSDIYDEWAKGGNPGWTYKDVLPLFKKSENFIASPITSKETLTSVSSRFHSKGGRLTVDNNFFDARSFPIQQAFEEAYISRGYKRNLDFNGESSVGYGNVTSTTKAGYRFSVARAYLLDVPENLKVCKYAMVDKVIFRSATKTAKGVSFIRLGKTKKVFTSKEVILSAGTFGTVGILERSGIGRQKILDKIQVPVYHELPGVGENLQDHFWSLGNMYAIDNVPAVPPNPLSLNLLGFQYFLNSKDANSTRANIQKFSNLMPAAAFSLVFNVKQEISDYIAKVAGRRTLLTFTDIVVYTKSRGHIHSTSSDPNSIPDIIINALSHPVDKAAMLYALKLSQSLMDSESFKKFNPEFIAIPQCTKGGIAPRSDEYYYCLMKTMMTSLYHPVGSCKMGPIEDKMAVVDHKLRVHGIRNLRIADGSIMPNITRGNTNAPIIMIGEKIAEMIKKKYGYTGSI